MMKKQRAFSLAELLISLLVTSMVLAATVPTVTRKMASTNENTWNRTSGEDITARIGDSQKVLIGATGGGILPLKTLN